MLVFDMIGLHIMFIYSNMQKVLALNVEKISYFCLPHLVEMSALRMLSIHIALMMVKFMCCENVSFGS